MNRIFGDSKAKEENVIIICLQKKVILEDDNWPKKKYTN